MRLIIFFSFITVLFSCSNQKNNTISDIPFDTKTFFTAEIKRLNKQHILLEKEIIFGDKNETKLIDSIDWKQELNPFVEIDLLKPSYNGLFKKDSLRIDEYHYLIAYSTSDKKINLKKVEITFNILMQKPISFYFLVSENNTVYQSEKTLTYFVDSAFKIEGAQHVKLVDDIKYAIYARIVKH